MELEQAHVFADRLRPNIEALAAMPDEALREQATNSLLHSQQAEEAADVLRKGLSSAVGEYALIRSVQGLNETLLGPEPEKLVEEFNQSRRTAENTCEPVERVPFSWDERLNKEVPDHIDNLVERVRTVKREFTQQSKNLGQKKLAKLQSREKTRLHAELQQPIAGREELGDHIADDPAGFAAVADELLLRYLDQALPEQTRQLYKELGTLLVKNGSEYVALHADRLSQKTDYIATLLATFGREMQDNPGNKGGAAHLLQGYFSSIRTPEQAVGRMTAMYEALVAGYSNHTLTTGAVAILSLAQDFFASTPYYENFEIARSSFHKPELRQRAIHLRQLREYVAINVDDGPIGLGAASHKFKAIYDNIARIRKIPFEQKMHQAYKESHNAAGYEAYVVYEKNERTNHFRQFVEANPQLRNETGEDSQLIAEYMRQYPGKDPYLEALYREPYDLAQRYRRAIGGTNFNITNGVLLPVNHAYVYEIVWPRNVTQDEVNAYLQTLQQDFANNQESLLASLAQSKESLSYAALSNYYQEELIVSQATKRGLTLEASIRPRTLLDNELIEPGADFSLRGFQTSEAIPGREESQAHIDAHKTRFVPKRGVEIILTDPLVKNSGLSKLVFRSGGGDRIIAEAIIHNTKRIFQIKNGKFYTYRGNLAAVDKEFSNEFLPTHQAMVDFADYCMHALGSWMCKPKVETSEGTIEEGKDGPIKGGYFAYLPVRDADGKKFQRSDKQWELCAEERGLDLDEESKRLALLDTSGKMRNSTYVREHPDDGAHLEPLKIYL